MMSSSRDVVLKLSVTSPQKLFPSDCITMYLVLPGLHVHQGHVVVLKRSTGEKKIIDFDVFYLINFEDFWYVYLVN